MGRLDDLVGRAKVVRVPTDQTAPPTLPPGIEGTPYGRRALASELATLAATTEGSRNDQLNRSAFNMGQLIAGNHLDHGHTWHELHDTALYIGLTDKETRDTLASAFHASSMVPRVVEALGEPPEPTILRVPSVAEDDAQDLRDRYPALDWHALYADTTEDEWLLEPLIPARRLIALFSAPKVGKSLLMLEVAVQIARGCEVLGFKPDRPRRVLYVDFENDPRGDIRVRLRAMGVTPWHLDNLRYLSFPTLPFLDTAMGGYTLLALAKAYDVDLVVIDTISRSVTGEENDNDTWLAFYRHTGLRLKAAGIACIRLDHTGKDATRGMRGGSAKSGDVDVVWSLRKVADTRLALTCEANRLPISEKELLVQRSLDADGHLTHQVDTGSRGAAFSIEADAIADLLDKLGAEAGMGSRAAKAFLHSTGHEVAKHLVELAVRRRKTRPTTVQEPLHDPRWKED